MFLRPRTDSAANSTQKNAQEDFAALVENAAKTAQGGLLVPELTPDKKELNPSAEFLTQSSLAQLQISRLKLERGDNLTPRDAAKEVEQTLGLLEDYAIALGDPSNSLKDLAPMAEELSFSADSLDKLSRGLANGDPLKDLSSETAALAAVEALKFKRGDFV
ncbi:MAG: hypothetical protein LBR53_03750 [Deltaproteobacteria bacterium]|nr:hypothetical protein [Deltaproteobacteria bacterium]